MAKLRYVVDHEFIARKPGNPENALPMRQGFHLFADVDANGAVVCFDLDAHEWEADREAFLESTRLVHPDEIKPPSY